MLLLLLHHTKSQQKISMITGRDDWAHCQLLKDTLGQKPNKRNLRRFFASPIILKLWFAEQGYQYRGEHRQVINEQPTILRQHFYHLAEDVQPAGHRRLFE